MARFCSFMVIVSFVAVSNSAYVTWTSSKGNRTDLKCPQSCTNKKGEASDDCCVCNAAPTWHVTFKYNNLTIEYVSQIGLGIIVGDDSKFQTSVLEHKNEYLSDMPLNLCNFTNIFEINLQNNTIGNVGNVSCLTNLYSLDLSFNTINHISKDTFAPFTYLKVLNISHNCIVTIEASAIAGPSLALAQLDVSFNYLAQLEVSNIIPEHIFCEYNFMYNRIMKLENKGRFKLNLDKIYKGGLVKLNSNNFTKFIDFKELGITNIQHFAEVIAFGFVLPNLDCDCYLEPYLEIQQQILNKLWINYPNMSCINPPEHRNLSISNLVSGRNLDIFVCNISYKCPRYCHCFYLPINRTTVVYCVNANLENIPVFVPETSNLTLKFNNNSIRKLELRDYFKNASFIDVSGNGLQKVSTDFIVQIESSVEVVLWGHNLTHLSHNFYLLNPCNVKLGKIEVDCTCEDMWIKNWLEINRASQCTADTLIFCSTSNGLIEALKMTKDSLCNETKDMLISIIVSGGLLLALILFLFILLYCYRYEIFILTRTYRSVHSNKVIGSSIFDVYLSFDDSRTDIKDWVINTLLVQLKQAGYRVFIPTFPNQGMKTKAYIEEKVNCCKNFVVILSKRYKINGRSNTEWNFIWNCYRKNKERQIVIINYDLVESVKDPKLKAFIRLGIDVDFSNKKHCLIRDVKIKLGPAYCARHYLGNAKSKFNPSHLQIKPQDIFDENEQSSTSFTDLSKINKDDPDIAATDLFIHIIDNKGDKCAKSNFKSNRYYKQLTK